MNFLLFIVVRQLSLFVITAMLHERQGSKLTATRLSVQQFFGLITKKREPPATIEKLLTRIDLHFITVFYEDGI